MVVLNTYGKIDPLCISQKLKLYISNLPCSEDDDWHTELLQEMKIALARNVLECNKLNIEPSIHIRDLHAKRFPDSQLPQDASVDALLTEIADNMICLYFDYEYDDMPMGDWTTNCFDGRLCEEDYAEKIVNFMVFLSYGHDERIPRYTPQWIYSSNEDNPMPHRIFWSGPSISDILNSLIEWGQMLDAFLVERSDYLQFDFLANALHEDGKYNTYHFLRSYSLCQLLLEKDKESELDWKLPMFLDDQYTEDERQHIAFLLRRIRNKIAHGDFAAYENEIEQYAVDVMDGRYNYDYSEYSRQNWCLLNACCKLDDAIRQMLILALTDRDALHKVKSSKSPDALNN